MKNIIFMIFGLMAILSLPLIGCGDPNTPGTGDDDDDIVGGDDDVTSDTYDLTVSADINGYEFDDDQDYVVAGIKLDGVDTGETTIATLEGLTGTPEIVLDKNGYCHPTVVAADEDELTIWMNPDLTGEWCDNYGCFDVTMHDDCSFAGFQPVGFELNGHDISYTTELDATITGSVSYDRNEVNIEICISGGNCSDYTYTRN